MHPSVRALLEMMELVDPASRTYIAKALPDLIAHCEVDDLYMLFVWSQVPPGYAYWHDLEEKLCDMGYEEILKGLK